MPSKRISKADMPCNKPRPSDRPGKRSVVKGCENGKEKIIHFGQAGVTGNTSPERRANFRSRHGCDTPAGKSKLTAKGWSCRAWTPSAPKLRK
jgi:hypothetical protein